MDLLAEIIVKLAFFNVFVEFIAAYVIYPFYKKYGLFKNFYHDFRSYHMPDKDSILVCNHGRERHAICKFCGKGIKQNRDGDWI